MKVVNFPVATKEPWVLIEAAKASVKQDRGRLRGERDYSYRTNQPVAHSLRRRIRPVPKPPSGRDSRSEFGKLQRTGKDRILRWLQHNSDSFDLRFTRHSRVTPRPCRPFRAHDVLVGLTHYDLPPSGLKTDSLRTLSSKETDFRRKWRSESPPPTPRMSSSETASKRS